MDPTSRKVVFKFSARADRGTGEERHQIRRPAEGCQAIETSGLANRIETVRRSSGDPETRRCLFWPASPHITCFLVYVDLHLRCLRRVQSFLMAILQMRTANYHVGVGLITASLLPKACLHSLVRHAASPRLSSQYFSTPIPLPCTWPPPCRMPQRPQPRSGRFI